MSLLVLVSLQPYILLTHGNFMVFYVYGCFSCMYVCASRVQCLSGQKWVPSAVKQMFVSCHVVLEIEPRSSAGAASTLGR